MRYRILLHSLPLSFFLSKIQSNIFFPTRNHVSFKYAMRGTITERNDSTGTRVKVAYENSQCNNIINSFIAPFQNDYYS